MATLYSVAAAESICRNSETVALVASRFCGHLRTHSIKKLGYINISTLERRATHTLHVDLDAGATVRLESFARFSSLSSLSSRSMLGGANVLADRPCQATTSARNAPRARVLTDRVAGSAVHRAYMYSRVVTPHGLSVLSSISIFRARARGDCKY